MKQFALGTILLIVGALVGCSNTNDTPINPEPISEQGTPQNTIPNTSPDTSEATMLTEEEAINIINQEIPGGEIVKIEHNLDDVMPNYDFKVIKDNMEYEIEVNAYDGSIRGIEKEIDTTKLNADKASKGIGEDQAKEIAQAQVPEGEIIGFEYEGDEALPNYDITIRDAQYEYDFEINALTGEIMKSEKELLMQ